jgi:hypothetical protein
LSGDKVHSGGQHAVLRFIQAGSDQANADAVGHDRQGQAPRSLRPVTLMR